MDEMEERFRREVRRAEVRVILRLVLVAAIVAAALALASCAEAGQPARPGAPLDALRYKAPSWAQGDALEIVDRDSGSSWWVLRVNGETLVLPVTVRDMDIRQIGG